MNVDPATIVSLVGALGVGGSSTAIIGYFKDRKRNDSDVHKTDVDTKLATLNIVIERLVAEVERGAELNDKTLKELEEERAASAALRRRVRELEEEIDGVRRSARETQNRCDDLDVRLRELLKDAQDK